MKKAIVLLLALVLVFGLCACTDTTQSILGERNESDEALDTPTYAMILHFTINPVFHIYWDKEQTILSVEAENEDAGYKEGYHKGKFPGEERSEHTEIALVYAV